MMDLHTFLKEYGRYVFRVKAPIAVDHEITALQYALEKKALRPIIYIEQPKLRNGEISETPLVCNLTASRCLAAEALGIIGWHGDLSVVRINWRHFRPLMSHRYHLPPSAHTTWVAGRFVVCTFVPRPIESDPGALKVPFYHNNDDFDEVNFYHAGNFFNRDNIKPGMVTFHPCGFTHGPHPKAFQVGATHARKETDEYAIMIDTRCPLEVAPLPEGVENREYVDSWKVKPA